MAKTAVKSTSSNGSVSARFKDFWNEHPEEIKVAFAAAAVAIFFTHGLPLWHDDYGHWLNQAQNGFGSALARLILPYTHEPQSWGYTDRPLQVVLYKILSVFGTSGAWGGTAFFLVKSMVFGALCGALYHWLGRLGVERFLRVIALAVLALSANALASVIEHHDFTVYGQLMLVLTLMWALPQVEKGPSSTAVYQKGWGKLPAEFKRFLITFFCLVYFGSKLGGDMRLAPIVLLAHLAIFHRERARVFAVPMVASLLATLPLLSFQMFKKLPPFMGGTGYPGLTYSSFNPTRLLEFLGKDIFSFTTTHVSLLGGMGVVATVAVVAFGIYRIYRERLSEPDSRWGFFLVWTSVALLACAIAAPTGDPKLQIRQTLVAMIPATILLGMILHAAYRDFSSFQWVRHAFIAGAVIQCGLQLFQSVEHRKYLGHIMTAVDGLYAKVEKDFPNSQLLLGSGFAYYGYRNSSPSIVGRKELRGNEDVASYPAGNTLMASWSSSLDPRLTLEYAASGCGSNAFDMIFRCEPHEGAMLLRYVGSPSEIAEADRYDKIGDLTTARKLVDQYLAKDPNNHGVGFVAGIYAYRASDVARMEQIYDKIGPYFPWHTAVVYNWGLAKQASQKYADATRLFERAHSMAPKDYAIGYNLADAYFNAGKKTRAIATIDRMLSYYPENEPMKRSRAQWSK
jgi:tetratricopeptide (TPR) repeat protein